MCNKENRSISLESANRDEMKQQTFNVGIIPWWRWAVASVSHPSIPGVPFIDKASAVNFYKQTCEKFPRSETVLLRKKLLGRQITVVERFRPEAK